MKKFDDVINKYRSAISEDAVQGTATAQQPAAQTAIGAAPPQGLRPTVMQVFKDWMDAAGIKDVNQFPDTPVTPQLMQQLTPILKKYSGTPATASPTPAAAPAQPAGTAAAPKAPPAAPATPTSTPVQSQQFA